ncbi:MAG: DUF6144 family protein [Oscillospiraceae bacterium]|jgi:hypothetical protein|nr:DUF6144 family protein [Oscillospiraceae bacterium]
MSEYTVFWDDKRIIPKFKQLVCEKLNEEAWEILTENICIPDPDTEGECGCCNMRVIINRLEEMTDKETIKSILFRVQHGMTREQIGDYKKEFNECGNNIDALLKHQQEQNKEEILRHYTNGTEYWGDIITDEVLKFMLNTEGVLSAVRKGSELHISRYPYNMTSYFNEADERKKRFYFCHCLFTRTSILSETGAVSKTMCYCSLGLVKAAWENTFDMELNGEVVKSVLGGDDICSFIIYLPDEIIKKYT